MPICLKKMIKIVIYKENMLIDKERCESAKGENMFYVPDGTILCGFYECEECSNRFLNIKVAPRIICPYCGEEPDMEIGPDEEMPAVTESAKLIKVVEGEEVEKYDSLLSLAVTGGDYNWI